ncbi:hypothetical protein BURMUCGD1_4218 [Burkholderia multivorans CGD1]|nr:hypothetical protein BURMUCGD1_4218 [Burkholderia multivorans CGD1]
MACACHGKVETFGAHVETRSSLGSRRAGVEPGPAVPDPLLRAQRPDAACALLWVTAAAAAS